MTRMVRSSRSAPSSPQMGTSKTGVAMRVQAAVAVVIAHRVGGAEIGDPAGFEQRNQPRLMLAGNRDRTGNRQRQRAAHADGLIENRVDAAQERSAERGEAVR